MLTFNRLQGLVGHLRSTFKPLFELYLVMKSRSGLQPPTADEIMYASGQKPFNSAAHALYVDKLEEHTASIKDAFAKQNAAAVVGFQFLRLQINIKSSCSSRLGIKSSLSDSLLNG
jgi:hypothetical protein